MSKLSFRRRQGRLTEEEARRQLRPVQPTLGLPWLSPFYNGDSGLDPIERFTSFLYFSPPLCALFGKTSEITERPGNLPATSLVVLVLLMYVR